jgi:adenylyltransferase/sulfurtransferase
LLLFDAQTATFTEVALRRDPACPVCGENPTISAYVDYVEFCNAGLPASGGDAAADTAAETRVVGI